MRTVELGPEADERPDTGRQVHDDERRLMERARERTDQIPDGCSIRLVALGEQVGIHPMRTRELGRTWANEERYVYRDDNPDQGRLTEKGRTQEL